MSDGLEAEDEALDSDNALTSVQQFRNLRLLEKQTIVGEREKDNAS
jgi:hypothetical protein